MRRNTTWAWALVTLGLAACSANTPGMPGQPDAGKTMRTQQVATFGTPEGGSVTTFTTAEPCQVPTVVSQAVPVQTPVLTQTPVTTAVPCTRLVPVTEAVPVTSVVPSVACATSVVEVPTIASTTVATPVQYSQYTTPVTRQGGCCGGFGGYGGFGYGGLGYGGLGYGGFGGGCGYGGLGYGGYW